MNYKRETPTNSKLYFQIISLVIPINIAYFMFGIYWIYHILSNCAAVLLDSGDNRVVFHQI